MCKNGINSGQQLGATRGNSFFISSKITTFASLVTNINALSLHVAHVRFWVFFQCFSKQSVKSMLKPKENAFKIWN